ncbi:MAG: hypothetical protein ABWY00_18870 [Dongiaceae bacterium]
MPVCHPAQLSRAWRRLCRTACLRLIGPAALLFLSGCQVTTAGAVYGLVEGSSLNQTGKTASDNLISTITGQDCNILRYQQTGKYCLSSAELAQIDAVERRDNAGYCYRTLALVTCYDQPDPAASSENRIH